VDRRQQTPGALQQPVYRFRWHFVLTCDERVRTMGELQTGSSAAKLLEWQGCDAGRTRTSILWNVHAFVASGRSMATCQLRRSGLPLASASGNTFIARRRARIERTCKPSCFTPVSPASARVPSVAAALSPSVTLGIALSETPMAWDAMTRILAGLVTEVCTSFYKLGAQSEGVSAAKKRSSFTR
jgi:hypothetical protein